MMVLREGDPEVDEEMMEEAVCAAFLAPFPEPLCIVYRTISRVISLSCLALSDSLI